MENVSKNWIPTVAYIVLLLSIVAMYSQNVAAMSAQQQLQADISYLNHKLKAVKTDDMKLAEQANKIETLQKSLDEANNIIETLNTEKQTLLKGAENLTCSTEITPPATEATPPAVTPAQ